ncbi:MAG: hypothetical protein KDA97_13180 [Acidimicrobiales bacterium]|nr:hypothetical protein [Acidimicrobiales bacterium]
MDPAAASRRAPAVAVGAISITVALATAAVASRGTFVHDDYWNLDTFGDRGWGWWFLGRPTFGHVVPGFNAAVAVVASLGGRWSVAVVQVAVLAGALPIAAFATARALGARQAPAIVAAALVASQVGWASAMTWWAAALNTYPVALAGMAVVAATPGIVRGRRSAAVAASAAMVVGASFTEGALAFLAYPLVALVLVPVPRGGHGVRRRVSVWWAARVQVAILGLPVAVAAAWRASAPEPLGRWPHPQPIDVVAFVPSFVARGLFPGLVGLVDHQVLVAGSRTATVVAAVVAVASIGVVALPRLGAGFRPALVGAVAVVVVRAAAVAWGRLEVLGWDLAVQARYVVDLAWMIPVLVVAHLPALAPPRRRVLVVVAVALVAAGLWGQAIVVADAPFHRARAYRDRVAASVAAAGPEVAVLDGAVPSTVLGPEFGAATFLSRALGAADQELPFSSRGPFVRIGPDGGAGRVRLVPVAGAGVADAYTEVGAPGVTHDGGCWTAGAAASTVWMPLSGPLGAGAWVVEVRFRPGSAGPLELVAADGGLRRSIHASEAALDHDRWLAPTLGFAGTQVGMVLGPGERACVRSVLVHDVVPA